MLDERRRRRRRRPTKTESGREPAGGAARDRVAGERDQRARRRAARAGRARRRRSSSELRQLVDVELEPRRAIATIRPRPTTTSEAATAITARAKIWPSCSPCRRENAISARFAAVEHDLEREQHDQRAAAEQHAERVRSRTGSRATTRYQATSGPCTVAASSALVLGHEACRARRRRPRRRAARSR